MQGRKDSDYNAKDVLQPVLQLVLGPGGEELRSLIEKEAIRVMEAVIVGTAIDSYKSVPEPLRSLIPGGVSGSFIRMKENEQAALLKLREQVLRVWSLLRSSRGFELKMLQPIVEVRLVSQFGIGGSNCLVPVLVSSVVHLAVHPGAVATRSTGPEWTCGWRNYKAACCPHTAASAIVAIVVSNHRVKSRLRTLTWLLTGGLHKAEWLQFCKTSCIMYIRFER